MVKKRTDRLIDISIAGEARQTLPNGRVAIVSAEDIDVLTRYSWSMDGRGYIIAFTGRVGGKQKFVKLHRLVMSAEDGAVVDHINGDKADCRRANLRFASKQGNAANIRKVRSLAGFKGVRISCRTERRDKPYAAGIIVNGRSIGLGIYSSPVEAAKAYDRAAMEYFGQFAATNRSMGLL